MRDGAVPEQSSQERQCVVGKRCVHEWLLSIEGLDRTAAWLPIVVERRLRQFWKQFCDGAQPRSGTLVHPIPRLSQDKLPAG